MVFSSLSFLLLFLPAALLIYFLSPRRARNAVLFIISLVFYAWGEPVYVVLMLFSTLTDYTIGRLMKRWDARPGLRRAALIASLTINFGLLGFFKYSGLLVETVNGLFSLSLPVPRIALPIGISFYTFQTLSYSIDVYRRNCPAQRNIISFGCYVAMFPQLIAGPIVRYIDVCDALERRRETWEGFYSGTGRFLCGMVKKVLLANGIGQLWEQAAAISPASLSALTAWLGAFAYAFQIYFDFSGYSDMAIGLGRMFGFTFPENFNYPYISRSVTDFWRRWHITLSTWFREYLYIPLGGNRVSPVRKVVNLLIVWLATGLWHGASWNFLAWGGYFGILLVLEKYAFRGAIEKLPAWLGRVLTGLLVLVGWVFFAHDSLADGAQYLLAMLGGGGSFVSGGTLRLLLDYLPLLLLCALAATPLGKTAFTCLTTSRPRLRSALTALLMLLGFALMLTYVVNAGYNPFLYFRF